LLNKHTGGLLTSVKDTVDHLASNGSIARSLEGGKDTLVVLSAGLGAEHDLGGLGGHHCKVRMGKVVVRRLKGSCGEEVK
jgi:hypothetical protein